MGGKPTGHPGGGVAYKGSVCEKSIVGRVAFVQYVTMDGQKGMNMRAIMNKVKDS